MIDAKLEIYELSTQEYNYMYISDTDAFYLDIQDE